jgi:hypothetical protein
VAKKKLSNREMAELLAEQGFDVTTNLTLRASKSAGKRGRGTITLVDAKKPTRTRHISRKPKEPVTQYEQRVLAEFWKYYKSLPTKRRWTKKEVLKVIRSMRKYHIYRDPHAVDWQLTPEENILAFKYKK